MYTCNKCGKPLYAYDRANIVPDIKKGFKHKVCPEIDNVESVEQVVESDEYKDFIDEDVKTEDY